MGIASIMMVLTGISRLLILDPWVVHRSLAKWTEYTRTQIYALPIRLTAVGDLNWMILLAVCGRVNKSKTQNTSIMSILPSEMMEFSL